MTDSQPPTTSTSLKDTPPAQLNGDHPKTTESASETVPAPVKEALQGVTSTDSPNKDNATTAAATTNGTATTETEAKDVDDTPLFPASLISDEVSSQLPEGYSIRPLNKRDYFNGFLDTLRVLTTVGQPTFTSFSQRYDFMTSVTSTYHILVILDPSSVIVGTGAVIVERKFIHNMGLVGHIEDIAVAKNQQGKKLGLRIIQALDCVAEKVGCYKSILDCSEANEGFYVKCGFKRAGLEMAHYYGRD